MRSGVFGGTFDPIHLAHLAAAEQLREVLALDRVLFVPSALPPHRELPLAGAESRLAMVRAACAGNPAFEACDLEVRRAGPSWAVDTLRELRRLHPGDDLVFIIGADAFAEIGSWREAPRLFELASFAVIPRPGRGEPDPAANLPPGLVIGEPGEEPGRRVWSLATGATVTLAAVTPLAISASDIRRRIREGRSVRYLVPEGARAVIDQQGLYRAPGEK